MDCLNLKIKKDDNIIVVGSGIVAVDCIKLLRDLVSGNIYVFEKQINNMSILKLQVSTLSNVHYDIIDEEIEMKILKLNASLIFSINNIFLFRDKIIDTHCIINYHNSLLPKHPGRNAESWCIYEDDEYSGITWHIVERKVDKGKIIYQEAVKLNKEMTPIKLLKLQNNIAIKSFIKIINDIFNKQQLKLYEKKKIKNIKFHFSKERPNNGFLNILWNAEQISRFLRAMDYGFLYTLGRPKVYLDNVIFTFDKYKIEKCDIIEPYENVYRENNNIIIKKGKYIFKLIGVKE